MKKRISIRDLLAALSITLLALGCWLIWNLGELPRVGAQDDRAAANRRMPDKEQTAALALRGLLSDKGITLDDGTLLPRQVERSKTARIQLRTVSVGAFSSDAPAASEVSLSSAVENGERLARPRSLELSTTQIVVIAVDRNRAARWWSLSPDPRVIRAETSDESGSLSGQTLYRRDASMLTSYPADPSIVALHLFQPKWDGQKFTLELIGVVDNLQ